MGSIVGKEQMQILEEKVNLLKAETELIYDGKHDLVEANYENGAFFTPKVFYNDKPFEKNISHELEAFGPVSTIMPYKDAEEAAALAKRGKGSFRRIDGKYRGNCYPGSFCTQISESGHHLYRG